MITFSILASLAAVSIAPSGTVIDKVETIRVTVAHRDLDLADGGDLRRLDRRVRNAIDDACPRNRFDLRSTQQALECRQIARAEAEGQVRIAVERANSVKAHFAAADGPPAA